MAVFKHDFRISFRDVDKNNKISNKAILEALEDIGGLQSDTVGYGFNNIKDTNLTWVLLYWKVRMFSRPSSKEQFSVHTWARNSTKIHTFRDFKIFDSNNKLIGIATSKWLLLNATTMKIEKITPEIMDKYEPEETLVFENEEEINKIQEPENYISSINYTVQRKDIDLNKHMHNTAYLDLAYEALPEEVYDNNNFNNFEIMYKKEIKLGETIVCYYSKIDDIHYITIKSIDNSILHAIIKLY